LENIAKKGPPPQVIIALMDFSVLLVKVLVHLSMILRVLMLATLGVLLCVQKVINVLKAPLIQFLVMLVAIKINPRVRLVSFAQPRPTINLLGKVNALKNAMMAFIAS
jgi:hypothetical protein